MYYPPEPRGVSAGAIIGAIGTIVLTLAAVTVAAVFVWKATGGVLPGVTTSTKPTIGTTMGGTTGRGSVNTGAQTGITDVQYNATAGAQQAAAIQEAAQVEQSPVQAPAGVDLQGQPIPTAVILIPTVAPVDQIVVVPQSMPVLAVDPLLPTAVPTMPYPTPLPAAIANDFEVSPDGTCITAPRNGKRYQVCQGWKYSPAEIATVADLIRGGTLPGVEVQ